jgi:DNA-binding MarR family transcriptional regulator
VAVFAGSGYVFQRSQHTLVFTFITLDNHRYHNYIRIVRLRNEIEQKMPFSSRAEEAFLNLQRTAAALMDGFEEMLKPYGLTHTQYNVLRILRGAGEEGLPCRELGERMITRDPDVTRLVDRMEKRGLVLRARTSRDRRIIFTRITEAGLALLSKLDEPVAEFHSRHLIDLLESARNAPC